MGQITVERNIGGIDGLCIITPAVHGDPRGCFVETYNQRDMEEAGFRFRFVQDNQSSSVGGVLRGLHYQKQYPQAKLVRVIRGEVFDVVVDLRKGSSTFGQACSILLTAENRKQCLIPRGFAHGYLVLSDFAEFCYKCDDYYHPADEGGIAWNDPALGIAWPRLEGAYRGTPDAEGYTVNGKPLILSDRDRRWGGLRDTFMF